MAQDNNGFVWFVAGAAIGATIALLYAPQSGRETRRIIKKKSREGREVLTETSLRPMDQGESCTRVPGLWTAAEMIERGRRLVEG